ncbi:tumor necrosis factor receptor superfamily member 19 [Bacillus oleivorans]|uniref:Tumor necrosis factor receptor superfamily member 19 n=1 Tax=Bacillus oleivorans TaxID=1448271 RepID=A0A285CVZ4_9BACI|nr:YtzI protein [Bacillus oleivorans]SNX71228.1 tumor necrosis factor receptor superfamily member 19 [Bacillus oleivorans]
MYTILIICVIIVIVVLLLAVLTTSKAYQYKHTVDPLENNPYLQNQDINENEDKKSE